MKREAVAVERRVQSALCWSCLSSCHHPAARAINIPAVVPSRADFEPLPMPGTAGGRTLKLDAALRSKPAEGILGGYFLDCILTRDDKFTEQRRRHFAWMTRDERETVCSWKRTNQSPLNDGHLYLYINSIIMNNRERFGRRRVMAALAGCRGTGS